MLFTSCQSEKNNEKEVFCSFTDSVGNQVKLAEKPEKTAVLFSSFADIWVTAGGSVDITVGESVERGFADDTAILVDGSAGKSIDLEKLIDSEPDLVICSADIEAQAQSAQMLKDAGIPCAQFRVESFDDYLKMLKICTDITGDTDAYKTYGTDVQVRINEALENMPKETEQKKILFIRSGSGESSAKAKTYKDHFAAAMLKEMGTYNIAENAPVLLDGLSIEEIMTEDPDVIFIATMGKEEAAKEYMDSVIASTPWQSLTAVKEGRCYYLPKDLFQFKPNSKWDKAYQHLSELLR